MRGPLVHGAAALVLAKAPVPGQVKTRLAAAVGDDAAAALAAAALLDTLDACEAAFGECHLALAGDLDRAVRSAELRERLSMWTVHPQRGAGLAERLVHAHTDAAVPGRPVVQLGMDTPQVTATALAAVAARLDHHDAVLGMAADGGWWVLAVTGSRWVTPLAGVAMSTPRTGADTEAALTRAGARVTAAPVLRDVDEAGDAASVAAAAPETRFARLWRELAAQELAG